MTKPLLLLNGLAALALPTYHAAAYGFSAMFEYTNRYRAVEVPNYDYLGSLAYHFLLLVQQLDAFVIPAFLFVSGSFVAFAARAEPSTIKWEIMIVRIKALAIPFVIWTIICFLLLHQPPATIHDTLRPSYFIVLLAQCYLLSPLLIRLAKRHGRLLLASSLLIQGAGRRSVFRRPAGGHRAWSEARVAAAAALVLPARYLLVYHGGNGRIAPPAPVSVADALSVAASGRHDPAGRSGPGGV